MARPEIEELKVYCRRILWEEVFSAKHGDRVNLKVAVTTYLIGKGVLSSLLAEEFAEEQLGLACYEFSETCEEWVSLGIPPPLWAADQSGLLLTWKHPKFHDITDTKALSEHFPFFWDAIKNCTPTELLFFLAAYLFTLRCDNIYITDKSGDGGIDLIGRMADGPFRGLCLLVQSKYAKFSVERDSFLCDYSKSLLAERTGRWKQYADDIGLSSSSDGFSKTHIFATNREFRPSIRDAARDFNIMLRSGRQIAHRLSGHFTPAQFAAMRGRVSSIEGSTKLDYAKIFSAAS